MKLVDTNVLPYAADRRSLQHESARSWLGRTLASGDPLLLPWVCIVGFIALALQYDSSVVSYDHDFALFPDVRWERPPPVPED
jgi:predicted nucleic acid-binding protein